MKISLSPTASNKTTNISVSGEVITYDGVDYDLSLIPDGGEVEADYPAVGIIKRVDGEIEVTLFYFYDSRTATEEQRFPNNPYSITEGILNV